jgi:hypothetical protein
MAHCVPGHAVNLHHTFRVGHNFAVPLLYGCIAVPAVTLRRCTVTSSRRAASRAGRGETARRRVRRALRPRSVRVGSRYGCSSPTRLLPGVTRVCDARDTLVRRG